MKYTTRQTLNCAALFFTITLMAVSASATERIEGRVEGGGGPIARAEVTLWVTMSGAPRKRPRNPQRN